MTSLNNRELYDLVQALAHVVALLCYESEGNSEVGNKMHLQEEGLTGQQIVAIKFVLMKPRSNC